MANLEPVKTAGRSEKPATSATEVTSIAEHVSAGGASRREQRQQPPSRMSGAAPAVPGSPPEALEQRTMHVFISRALHKILREAPKKHTQLRAACQEVIGVPTDP